MSSMNEIKAGREPGKAAPDDDNALPRPVLHRAQLSGPSRVASALPLFLVFLLTGLYLLPVVPFGLNPYDEGVRLYGADQVLSGHIPYYDFFAYYGPAQFYWPALLFKLFGTQIMVARLGTLVFICVAAVALFSICRHARLSLLWTSIPIAALLAPLGTGDQLVACDPALSLILAAAASLTGAWGLPRNEFTAGSLLGLAATFRPDFGLYGVVAGVAVSLWRSRSGSDAPHYSSLPGNRLVGPLWHLGFLVGGIATTAVPFFGLLSSYGPRHLIGALFVTPARLMPFRTLPYAYYELPYLNAWISGRPVPPPALPDPQTAVVFLTPLVGLLLSLRLLQRRERKQLPRQNEQIPTLLFTLITAGGLGIYALGRGDWYHVYPLHVFSALAVSLILGPRATGPGLAGILFVLISVAGIAPGIALRIALAVSSPSEVGVPLSLPRSRGIAVNESMAWVGAAVRDIWRYGDGGPILVGTPRHDRVHANAMILYFLAERPSGTYFQDMIPGLTTTRRVQEHIVADLMNSHVRTVVISKATPPDEPNKSRLPSGVSVLDDYLRSEFSRVLQTDNYDILVKRE